VQRLAPINAQSRLFFGSEVDLNLRIPEGHLIAAAIAAAH
jgi:hypothetical protein